MTEKYITVMLIESHADVAVENLRLEWQTVGAFDGLAEKPNGSSGIAPTLTMTIDEVIVILSSVERVTDIRSTCLGGLVNEHNVGGIRMTQLEVLDEIITDVIQCYLSECPCQKHNIRDYQDTN